MKAFAVLFALAASPVLASYSDALCKGGLIRTHTGLGYSTSGGKPVVASPGTAQFAREGGKLFVKLDGKYLCDVPQDQTNMVILDKGEECCEVEVRDAVQYHTIVDANDKPFDGKIGIFFTKYKHYMSDSGGAAGAVPQTRTWLRIWEYTDVQCPAEYYPVDGCTRYSVLTNHNGGYVVAGNSPKGAAFAATDATVVLENGRYFLKQGDNYICDDNPKDDQHAPSVQAKPEDCCALEIRNAAKYHDGDNPKPEQVGLFFIKTKHYLSDNGSNSAVPGTRTWVRDWEFHTLACISPHKHSVY